MKHSLAKLITELRSFVRGWCALRTIQFNKYRIHPARREQQIEERILRGLRDNLHSTSTA